MLGFIKWALTCSAVALPPAMYLLPALAERRGFVFWLLYILLVLLTAFLWGIAGKGNRHVADGFTPEENRKLQETQEILHRGRFWM